MQPAVIRHTVNGVRMFLLLCNDLHTKATVMLFVVMLCYVIATLTWQSMYVLSTRCTVSHSYAEIFHSCWQRCTARLRV